MCRQLRKQPELLRVPVLRPEPERGLLRVRERLLPVLHRLGLPTQVHADPEAVFAELLHDKKMTDGAIAAVFVETPGRSELRQMPPEALRAGIEMVVKA